MASGLVPITTEHCGAADFTYLKNSHWRVPAYSTNELRDRIEQLIESPETIPGLRDQAINAAKSMTWDRYKAHIGSFLAP